LRAVDHREVPASRRFELLFQHLGLEPGVVAPEAVELLLQTHGRELSKASEFPSHHAPLLRRLARDYRLAVVSNFDYTPTASRSWRVSSRADRGTHRVHLTNRRA